MPASAMIIGEPIFTLSGGESGATAAGAPLAAGALDAPEAADALLPVGAPLAAGALGCADWPPIPQASSAQSATTCPAPRRPVRTPGKPNMVLAPVSWCRAGGRAGIACAGESGESGTRVGRPAAPPSSAQCAVSAARLSSNGGRGLRGGGALAYS